MKITDSDIRWLRLHFPNLYYDADSHKILGELDFCAVYDQESGKVTIAELAEETDFLIQDVFEIEIYVDDLDMNGWSKVFEVGGRHHQIAQENSVNTADLHFYSDDDNCCLGIKCGNNSGLRIERFFDDLVIPFFYRLSYTDKFGIDRARRDLWGEYSHGDKGEIEYFLEIMDIARHNPGRNDPCPCGSGKKYKKCHLGEVESLKNSLRRRSPSAATHSRC